MAETVVKLFIDNLVPLLTQEEKLLKGIHKELDNVRVELQLIQPFLRAADERIERGGINEGVKVWVTEVRKISYQIEDVIDEYMLHQSQCPQQRGFLGFLRKIAQLIIKLKPQHVIASQIQDIKEKLRLINVKARTFGFSSIDQQMLTNGGMKEEQWPDPRLESLFIEEDKAVGIEVPREKLITTLVEGNLCRMVISVVGMAGLGKTTLVKKVYDNIKVIGHFVCRAWIPVSQSYEKDKLLKKMIKELHLSKKESVPEGLDTMDDKSLIILLRDYLGKQRYLLVFDDVWDIHFWSFIKHALPNTGGKGSRVVITTRSNDVATCCIESPFDYIHELKPLPEEKGLDLFCNKAFQSDYGTVCPPELEDLSRGIVKRCGGLPLAIVVIGGLLATKQKSVLQWKKFLDSLGSLLGSDPSLIGIKKILSLSYFELPYHLKVCYLYFCMFPEDYSISCVRLIRLWIAEGFVKEKAGRTLEEVAKEYLTELSHSSLVQVSRVNFDGEARTCQVHDLMREIILLISEELLFCQTLQKRDSCFNGQSRSVSIHRSPNYVMAESRVRSVLWFDGEKLPESFIRRLSTTFKLLKVMDFIDAPLNDLPEDVGSLFHLRYLSLRNTSNTSLPKSIGRLWNLLTLDLKDTYVTKLPVEINKLNKLRHLLAYYFDKATDFHLDSRRGVKMQPGFGSLEALQKLFFVDANHGCDLIEELRKLRQLRKLGIKNLKCEDGRALCSTIEQMSHLESLDVTSVSDKVLDLQHISSPPCFLRRLYLQGHLEKFPDWISASKLQNVVRIGLYGSGLTEDPLKFLKDLPSLLELRLVGAYDGECLHFEGAGFRKLKLVKIRYLNELNSVIIERGALPVLQELQLGPVPKLKTAPSGIQDLKSLTTLRFSMICQMHLYVDYRESKEQLHLCGNQSLYLQRHRRKFKLLIEGKVINLLKLEGKVLNLLMHLEEKSRQPKKVKIIRSLKRTHVQMFFYINQGIEDTKRMILQLILFSDTSIQDHLEKVSPEFGKGCLRSARDLLTNNGEVHMIHKTTYPFNKWEHCSSR